MKLADQIKSVQIIFFALLAAQVMFLFISVFLVQSVKVNPNGDLLLILFIVNLLIITSFIVSGKLIHRRFTEGANSKKLTE